jgi:hypothetical protein
MPLPTTNLLQVPNLLQTPNLLQVTNQLLAGGQSQPAPTFDPPEGPYSSAQSVSITSADPDATYHYTIDGSTPTPSSALYVGPLSISSSLTLKAIAVGANGTSAVSSAAYTISIGNAPTFVQSVINSETVGSFSFSASLDTPASEGNTILVYFQAVPFSGSVELDSITDDAGNTYTLVSGPDVNPSDGFGNGNYRWVYICLSISGTPQTFTANSVSLPLGSFKALAVVEIHGASAVDSRHYSDVSGTNWVDSAGVTTDEVDCYLCSFLGCLNVNGPTFTAGTGWLVRQQEILVSFGTTNVGAVGIQDQTVSAADNYSVTASCSIANQGGIETVALKP